ncbi:extracellular serine/threonine protein CG31145-like isoform X2 [Mya arenaria]|uniref:extracellular serine/threonine protein CG31145-like isoform X2 n=1 Tax=Mya arenaria TaxID=6604 RepID=UPI0022E3D52A|nr:extracellular serine/threonine protein CG31145-like isoform X2 [Mya arenaria]XP_052765522.1 extracellular serine/threonine protein CG31145-like isoform X2 [Mya arenaria]
MYKKLTRYAKVITAIAVPVILLFTCINVLVLSRFGAHDTTLILREKVYHKGGASDGTSSSDAVRQPPLPVLREGGDKTDDEVKKISGNGERKSGDGDPDALRYKRVRNPGRVVMQDDGIDAMLAKLRTPKLTPFFPSYYSNITFSNLVRRLGGMTRRNAPTLEGYEELKPKPGDPELPIWKKVHRNIRQFSLYDPDDPNLAALMHDMATLPIKETDENDGGTQLKLNIRFSNGGRAVMKFMRYPREKEASENHYIFDDTERHVAEIAAFQLDKVLGFYRVPPTVGRRLNITSEIQPIAPDSLFRTMFWSPAGNKCFFGKCDYYCNSAHAFCGNPEMIEASVMSYLPSRNIALRKSWYQPWRRSYSASPWSLSRKFRKAYWELHDDLCETVRYEEPFNNGKILLDMIDSHTFDFLQGNKDRHSFSTFKEWGNYSFPIMYDNGRGFGRQTYDAMSILAPLRQCCLIRKSTLLKYIRLYEGPERLSEVMEEALRPDPVAPVLIQGHLNALDRRLIKILQIVAKCVEEKGVKEVVIADKF